LPDRHTHINQAWQQVAGAWVARGNGQESLIALRSPVLTGPQLRRFPGCG